jgi:membrane-associated phospholipid phosphatase
MSTSSASRGRSAGRRALLLLLGWLVVVGVVIAVGLMLTGPLRRTVNPADNDAVRWFVSQRSSSLTTAAQSARLLGETWTALTLGPLLLVVTWLWRRDWRPVSFVAVAMLGEISAYLVVVHLVSRPRPPVLLLDGGLDPQHSYPSGHVAAAAAMYGAMAVLLWTFATKPWRWLGAVLVVLPPVVALTRLYEGVHHITDVVTSLAFMSAWLAIAAAILLPDAPRDRSHAWRGQFARPGASTSD